MWHAAGMIAAGVMAFGLAACDKKGETPKPAASAVAPGPVESAAGKMGAAVDDTVVTTRVKSALLADASVKGTDVSVETRGGKVELSGNVSTQAEADRAGSIARGVDGVAGVDNKLSVKK